jgi:hypothetical protein
MSEEDRPPPRDDDRNEELDDSPVPDPESGPSTEDEDTAAAD